MLRNLVGAVAVTVVLGTPACSPWAPPEDDVGSTQPDNDMVVTEVPYGPDEEGFDSPFVAPIGGCPEIYGQDLLPTFEIEIDDYEWDALRQAWEDGVAMEEDNDDPKLYHPLLKFRYEDETYYDVMIRLKGSTMHWEKTPDKMQFNVSFMEIDDNQRFHGLRKLILDAPDYDPSLLRDRLAQSVFRDMGVPAPCVNHARLVVNGDYYGVFANIERVDQEFLKRRFGSDSKGNLYKYGDKQTNKSDPDSSDFEEWADASKLSTLEKVLDLDECILEWAGEGMMPFVDGFWSGSDNFIMYNHPKRGFLFIPWDIDDSLESMQYHVDPFDYHMTWGSEDKPPQWKLVMADAGYKAHFVKSLKAARKAYDPEVLQERIDQWSAQIADAMAEDDNKPFSTSTHKKQVALLREFVEKRAEFVDGWLNCYEGTGKLEVKEILGRSFGFYFPVCSWERAEQLCEERGGTLAVPGNAEDLSELMKQAEDFIDAYWWIGANDIEDDGAWVGPDGKSLDYEPWGSGQPDGDEDQNCAVMDPDSDGEWADKDCRESFPSICEMP